MIKFVPKQNWSLSLFAVALLLLTSGFHAPQEFDPNDPTLSQYFISPSSEAVMEKVADKFEVLHKESNGYEIIVPAHRSSELMELVPDAKLQVYDISAHLREMDESWAGGYHTLPTVEQHLRQIASRYPDIAAIKTYGKTKEGRPLYVLKISDNVQMNENEPEVMITSSTHGNELISVEVVLGIIDSLIQNYRSNRRVRQLIDSHEIFFIPVVNADGYVRKSRYANGVDPNREYPWPGKPIRQPNECIASLIKFFHSRDIKGSLDFHSYGGMFMYPWAYTRNRPADLQTFDRIAKALAQTNGYRYGQISRLLYPAKGSSADYYYWKNRTIGLGIEIGTAHAPNPNQIPKYVREHLASTILFIEAFR